MFRHGAPKVHTGHLSLCVISSLNFTCPLLGWKAYHFEPGELSVWSKILPIADTRHRATLVTTSWLVSLPMASSHLHVFLVSRGGPLPLRRYIQCEQKLQPGIQRPCPSGPPADTQSLLGFFGQLTRRNVNSFYLLHGASARTEHTWKHWLLVMNTWPSFSYHFAAKEIRA